LENSGATRATGRLATRVVIAAIGSAAFGGAVAALVAVVAVDRLVSDHMDRGLTGAALRLSDELEEDEREGDPEGLEETVRDENEEIAASGIRFAVYQDGALLAGDATVPAVASEQCATLGPERARVRVCGARYKAWSLYAATKSDGGTLRLIYALGGLGALVLGGFTGALVGVRLARWALTPLTELGSALRHMADHAADGQALALRSSCEEVQEIASAIDELLLRIRALLGQAQRFAAHAAHELRTPLTTIQAELELLIEEGEKRPEQAALERIRQRTTQLAELVERLLFLASPPSRARRAFEAVALSDLIEELVAQLAVADRERVRLSLADEGLMRGEPSLLRAMIANAIDNALKHSGADHVDVELTANDAPAMLHLTVSDSGRGIAPELRRRVFEPFYRASPDMVTGHGLGLTLIGHIAEAHGGSASFIDSERGARLRLALPRWRPSAEAAVPDSAS
jgi:two-component system, OmpR family, sensor kinase